MRILDETALTFDDVLLIPRHSTVLPKDVLLNTHITREIRLNIPLVSAAMDTVSEFKMAIAMAQEGGIGILHKNMTIDQQVEQLRQVKKYESGIISDPITALPETTVGDLLKIIDKYQISGMPVVSEKGELMGIVTQRDWRFENNYQLPISEIMTPKARLVTVLEGTPHEEVVALFKQHRLEKILVVNKQFELRGMMTVKDIQKQKDKPLACKDAKQRLRVGAAVGTGTETKERVAGLVQAGVDILVVDTAHGHAQGVLDTVKWIKTTYPSVQVIGGNIATAEAALALVEMGADGVKVGIGPGSICTTRVVAGVGMPQITAVMNVAKALKGTGVPVIADGGVRYSGDIAKAIAAGASVVMIGGLLAGTEEAPGEVILYQGRSYKAYRGMGSLGAMSQQQGSSDRYFQSKDQGIDKLVPEGIEGRVPYRGNMITIVHQLLGGLRSSMGYCGAKNILEMQTETTFVKMTAAGVRESHVHDVSITKEAPNYRREGD